jgi:hypothetical protein
MHLLAKQGCQDALLLIVYEGVLLSSLSLQGQVLEESYRREARREALGGED